MSRHYIHVFHRYGVQSKFNERIQFHVSTTGPDRDVA